MKKNLRNTCAKTLALVMAAAMVVTAAPVSADAKAQKPKLSKTKVTVKKGKKVTIKVKDAKPKKTTWSVDKKGKKYVSLSKKKKTSVVIKGKKKGKATVTAKIKVGKKTYKKTVKVTVKGGGGSTEATEAPAATTAAASQAPASKAPASQAPASKAPASKAPASKAPASQAPASQAPASSAPTSVVPATNEPPKGPMATLPSVQISADNEGAGTKDKDSYRADVEWDTENQSVTFTNMNGYNGGMMLNLQADGSPADISMYDYVQAEVKTKDEVMVKFMTDSADFWSCQNVGDGWFEGTANLASETRTVLINISKIKKKIRSSIAAIDLTAKGVGADGAASPSEITIYSIKFLEEAPAQSTTPAASGEPSTSAPAASGEPAASAPAASGEPAASSVPTATGSATTATDSPAPTETDPPEGSIVLTGSALGAKAAYTACYGQYKEPAFIEIPYGQLKDAKKIVMGVEKTAEDFKDIQLKATIGGLGEPSAMYGGFDSLTGAKIKEKYDGIENPSVELTDDTKIKMAVQTMSAGLTGKITITGLTVDDQAIDISAQKFTEWDFAEETAPAAWSTTAEVSLKGYDLTKFSSLTVKYECDDPACEVFADIGVNSWTPTQRQYTDKQGKIEVNLAAENTLNGKDPGANSGKTQDYASDKDYGVYLRISPDKELQFGKKVTITQLTLVPKEADA